ncbi:phosphoenolpyruvate carboxykinase, partial [Helicosporidium sp. ATCC 50920]
MERVQGSKRTERQQAKQAQSLSDTLRSAMRETGPRVVTNEVSKHTYLPTSPRSAATASMFVKAISDCGLRELPVYHNLTPSELYEKALMYEPGSHVLASGALAALSGAKTGRSPKDKRVVREAESEADVWWGEGSPNFEMDEATFIINRERAVDYLNMLDRLYVFDGYAGWDPEARYKIRVVCGRPYHALFMNNMLIRPSQEELASFGTPDFTIYNAGAFPANRRTSYMTSSTSIDMSFKHREMVILGTQYAGEMKKGVFTLMNYWLPKRGILSLHSGCNVGAAGDVTLFFGLSGTGKTTLSADPRRPLIGDDEHGWGDKGVFNIEGGC